MTDAPQTGQGWPSFLRWGPYALLGFGAFIAFATARVLMSTAEMYAAAVLTAAALGWQLAWDARLRQLPEPDRRRVVYFVVRTALAAALSGINPFFSIYAVMGYFDAGRQLARRQRRWGLLAIAATLAAAQATVPDGPAPGSTLQLTVFLALFALHTSLALVLDRLSDQEAERHRQQRATIEELELTNARLEQALTENATLQAQLLVQAREAGITDERRRLAAEIHDTLAQGLAGIITQLQAAAESTDEDTARAHAERAATLARYSLGEARRSVHNLAPGPLEHRTLPEALKETVARWQATSAPRLELVITGTVEPLHMEIESTLLRITEEALGNAAKHADAARVGVTLSYLDDEVAVDIRDDGRGFDPLSQPSHSARGGFGLDGMRLRAARVAGTVEIETEPGGGTAVSARVPLVRDDS
jgi:signal transduction histidine kinase